MTRFFGGLKAQLEEKQALNQEKHKMVLNVNETKKKIRKHFAQEFKAKEHVKNAVLEDIQNNIINVENKIYGIKKIIQEKEEINRQYQEELKNLNLVSVREKEDNEEEAKIKHANKKNDGFFAKFSKNVDKNRTIQKCVRKS